MDLSPAHLRALREIVRRSSFSRAAEALHLSQPAVSHQIRQLEGQLGVALLERMGKRVFPTAAGRLLLERGGRILDDLDAAAQHVRSLGGRVGGRVRIGTGATASIYLLPPLLRELHARHPELDLVVVTGNGDSIASDVAANELDLGVVTLPVRGRQLSIAPFCADPLVAIAPPEWDGPRRALTPRDLSSWPLILYERGGTIRRVIEAWFRRAGATPRVAMELGNSEAIKKLVEAGLGLSVTPAITVKAEVASGALCAGRLSPPLARALGIVTRRDKAMSPALDVVLSALRGFGARRGARGGAIGVTRAGAARARRTPA